MLKTLLSILLLTVLTATASAQSIKPVTLAKGLDHPWAVAFLPAGQFLVSERGGALRVVQANGEVGPPLDGLPAVAAGGQGGLLDVILDSDFARNRSLYFCYSEPAASGSGNSTALASARLSSDMRRLESVRVLFSQQPKVASQLHFGCRIVESKNADGRPDGLLYLTLGERYRQRDDAQSLDNHHGKVVRIGKDGRVPADNPFVGRAGALPEIWSLGHRNPQGAALSPDGVLWIHEHGPMGGDEINLPRPGANFGWPLVSFGKNYNFTAVGDAGTARSGTEPPLHQWTPSIAPSGMAFVSSERYGKAWVGNLLVGSLKFTYLARLELTRPFEGKVVRETRLLEDLGERIRDVRQGPDGYLYVVTDSANGQLIRLLPAP
ncbi:PQQ-dependent sugar dehydrogenase [Dechloromonas hortensis]|uniref:PQQ-dependent sugar dehydrogenase n=1 Tax=Dechloromonas hortensis TaxID=337779 RepID=UPI001291C606|nr:PQQ-dependent sugar dehydrogenase [Dechloromonas hortensis]